MGSAIAGAVEDHHTRKSRVRLFVVELNVACYVSSPDQLETSLEGTAQKHKAIDKAEASIAFSEDQVR